MGEGRANNDIFRERTRNDERVRGKKRDIGLNQEIKINVSLIEKEGFNVKITEKDKIVKSSRPIYFKRAK